MAMDDPNGNLDDDLVYFTTSARGKPAITIGDIRFLVMTESPKKILWRCSFMQVNLLKNSGPFNILNSNFSRTREGNARHELCSTKILIALYT